MGMEAVQGILEGLKIHQQKVLAQQQLQRQALQDERENEARQARLDLEREQLKQQHEYQQATLKAAQALHKVQHVESLQKIGQTSQETGQAPPGAQVQQPIPGMIGMPTIATLAGMGSEGQDISIPIFSDAVHNARLRAKKEAEVGPGIEGRLKEIDATKEADRLRAEANKAADLEKERARQLAEQAREKIRDDAALLRTQITAGARVKAAGIAHQAGASDFDPTPHVQGAFDGNVSQEDITRLPKDQKNVVVNEISKLGVVAPTEKQKQFVNGLAPALEVIPKMKQFNEILAAHPIEARIPGSKTKDILDNLADQIQSGVVSASTGVFGQSARAMQQAIKADTGAFTPKTQWTYQETNQKRMEGYIKLVEDAIDEQLGNLSSAQRQHIKERVGLDQHVGGQPPAAKAPKVIRYDAKGNLIKD